jgi:uncharacterized lipoprotein NlpE involved in copper resistance
MKKVFFLMSIILSCFGCTNRQAAFKEFDYKVDRFADMEIIRYQVPGFEDLSLRQKKLVYYLSEAALWGRDIIYDQNYRHNLLIRHCLEAIYQYADVSRQGEDWQAFEVYLKRLWVANGIHHHYSTDKFEPGFSQDFFVTALRAVPAEKLPSMESGRLTQEQNPLQTQDSLNTTQYADELAARLLPLIFDARLDAKRVNQAQGEDLIVSSACNYYRDLSQKEAEAFYAVLNNPENPCPVSYGLNSRLVKEEGQLREEVWKIGGLYSPALEKITYWLELALEVAENPRQKEIIQSLIDYYHSLDHMSLLGNNVLSIAGEKAGIIKSGRPAVVGINPSEVYRVLRKRALQEQAPFYLAEDLLQLQGETFNKGTKLKVKSGVWQELNTFTCGLAGQYIPENATLVLAALSLLKQDFIQINAPALLRGFEQVVPNTGIRGRWEILQEKPLCICDTGHNEAGIRLVTKQLAATPHKQLHIVLGVVNDKDIGAMLELLPQKALYYFTKAAVPRALPETELAALAAARNLKGQSYPTVAEAKAAALKAAAADDLIFIGGSNFIVAEAL